MVFGLAVGRLFLQRKKGKKDNYELTKLIEPSIQDNMQRLLIELVELKK